MNGTQHTVSLPDPNVGTVGNILIAVTTFIIFFVLGICGRFKTLFSGNDVKGFFGDDMRVSACTRRDLSIASNTFSPERLGKSQSMELRSFNFCASFFEVNMAS